MTIFKKMLALSVLLSAIFPLYFCYLFFIKALDLLAINYGISYNIPKSRTKRLTKQD